MKEIEYLENLNMFGVKPGLERVELLLEYLANPQDELEIIHIGGTNGKGSTSAILTSIYKEAGYKVGTYNSPHIIEFNERIRINDQNISNEELTELILEAKPEIERVAKTLEQPTYFEVVTALALLYFYQQGVDLVILEVGLGGRLDATNVVDSLISVITNISLDHTEYLGNSLEEIAFEKAGIIKEGQRVVTATKKEKVNDLFNKICNKREAELININDTFKCKENEIQLTYQSFDLLGANRDYNNLKLPLLGEHQMINTATALEVVESLEDKYPVALEAIKTGISKVRWPGRFEVVATEPTIILDGAHNVAGAKSLNKSLERIKYNNLILLLSILGDKDIEGIIKNLSNKADKIILSRNKNKRVADISRIEKEVEEYNLKIEVIKDLKEAIDYALNLAGKNDLVLISGSLYTVAEARSWLVGANLVFAPCK